MATTSAAPSNATGFFIGGISTVERTRVKGRQISFVVPADS
jgi:hypothetical protein